MKVGFMTFKTGSCFLVLVWLSASLAADTPAPSNSTSTSAAPLAPAPGAKKSQFNTQVFEKTDDKPDGFKDVVRIMRSIQDETQVFFMGKQGFYTLDMKNPNSGQYSQVLAKSMKNKIPVQVDADDYTRSIKKVSDAE